jgi:hypothetical protein
VVNLTPPLSAPAFCRADRLRRCLRDGTDGADRSHPGRCLAGNLARRTGAELDNYRPGARLFGGRRSHRWCKNLSQVAVPTDPLKGAIRVTDIPAGPVTDARGPAKNDRLFKLTNSFRCDIIISCNIHKTIVPRLQTLPARGRCRSADFLLPAAIPLFPRQEWCNFNGLILISFPSSARARGAAERSRAPRTAKDSQEQRQSPLFLRSSYSRRPRISAALEPSLADNFREKQRRTAG